MTTPRDLREQRDAALARAEAMLATARGEARDLSEAEDIDYRASLAEARRIDREIEVAEARRHAPAGRETAVGGLAAAEAEFRQLLKGELRSMSAAAGGPQGGFLVPEEIDRVLVDQLQEVSSLRGLASVTSTATPDFKVLVNRRGATSGWAGEIDTRAPTDTPILAEVQIPSGEVFAYPATSNWLIDDSLTDIAAFLATNVSEEMAIHEGAAFFHGSGTNRPRGFLTYDTSPEPDATRPFGELQHLPSGDAQGFPSEDPQDVLIGLMHRLRPSYRAGASWVMNDATAAEIRRWKDAEGRFLWVDGLTEGQPARLLGYPVVIAEEMPDVAADATPVAFGAWSRGYRIVDRTGLRVIRDEVTQPGWTRWYFARRVGGAVVDSNAIKLLRIGAAG